MRTHYDNLHVSEKASPEVIRAAYKALAQKWHPDKHSEQREKAERYFKIINRAFEVLSDQESRADYDAWLEEQRGNASESFSQALMEKSWNEGREAGVHGISSSTCTMSGTYRKAWLDGYQVGVERRAEMAEAWESGRRSGGRGGSSGDCPYLDDDLVRAWGEGFLAGLPRGQSSSGLHWFFMWLAIVLAATFIFGVMS